jgi:1,4-alpha-glucan branching enzyme
LHDLDFDVGGFEWIDCHDADQSVLVWLRRARDGSVVIVAANFTPVPRTNYRIGVPHTGAWREIFNSDSSHYGGGNLGNGAGLFAAPTPWMNQPAGLTLTLSPLALVVLQAV